MMNDERIKLSKYNPHLNKILAADKSARKYHSLPDHDNSNTKAGRARAISERFLIEVCESNDEVWMMQGDLRTRLEDGYGTFSPPLIDQWLESSRKDRGELHQCPSMKSR